METGSALCLGGRGGGGGGGGGGRGTETARGNSGGGDAASSLTPLTCDGLDGPPNAAVPRPVNHSITQAIVDRPGRPGRSAIRSLYYLNCLKQKSVKTVVC